MPVWRCPRNVLLLGGWLLLSPARAGAADAGTAPAVAAPYASPAFAVKPGWLVVGEAFRSPREAAPRAAERLEQRIAVAPIRSDHYEPGPSNLGSEKGRLLLDGELW